MTRGKVKLQMIANDSSRRATFKNRKKGLLKKLDELTKLCDVEACAIMYSPEDTQATLWPSPAGVQSTLGKFRALSDMEQSRKMMNLESYTKERIIKTHKRLKRLTQENEEKRLTLKLHEYLAADKFQQKSMHFPDVDGMRSLVGQTIEKITQRLVVLNMAETRGEASSSHNPFNLTGTQGEATSSHNPFNLAGTQGEASSSHHPFYLAETQGEASSSHHPVNLAGTQGEASSSHHSFYLADTQGGVRSSHHPFYLNVTQGEASSSHHPFNLPGTRGEPSLRHYLQNMATRSQQGPSLRHYPLNMAARSQDEPSSSYHPLNVARTQGEPSSSNRLNPSTTTLPTFF